MKKKFINILGEQFHKTMTYLGMIVSTIYIMRCLGFNDPLPWKWEMYPALVLGLFIGFVINVYLSPQEDN
jgi:hypothetical protein